MHRFYLPPEQCGGPTLVLAGREGHHALHVLRVRRGDRVAVLNGAGQVWHCDVAECGPAQVWLAVVEKQVVPAPACAITLLQAVPKGKLIESIIQKATELGVSRVVPLLSDRVVIRLEEAEAARKGGKWQGAAVEAIKQCGAAWLPKVEAPLTPRQFLDRGEPVELALVGSLRSDGRHPRDYFRTFFEHQGRKPQSMAVWVGPEGDFTPAELEAIRAAGALPITLGPLVLRADTAAICCLSILNYELLSP